MELDTPILTAINSPLLLTQDQTLTVLEDQCQHLMVSEWEITHSSTTHTVDELTHHDMLLFNFSLFLYVSACLKSCFPDKSLWKDTISPRETGITL